VPSELYVFIDESGDFNFSRKGSLHYLFTAVITDSPHKYEGEIKKLQMQILSREILPTLSSAYLDKYLSIKFHAAEDLQVVRDEFYKLIITMDNFVANSVVIRKYRTHPSLQEKNLFYSRFLGSLMAYVFRVYTFTSLCIIVAGCAVESNKDAFKKAVIFELHRRDPKIKFNIYFPPSGSMGFLQVVDYVNWAIFRKWENNDTRSYDLIRGFLRTPEKDLFRNGWKDFY
jgi:hypothetical protein